MLSDEQFLRGQNVCFCLEKKELLSGPHFVKWHQQFRQVLFAKKPQKQTLS